MGIKEFFGGRLAIARQKAAQRERTAFDVYWATDCRATAGEPASKGLSWHAWQTRAAARQAPRMVEFCTALFGMTGAILLATKFHPAWGFAAFLASNCWGIRFHARQGNWWLWAQQGFFLVSSLVGLWNWWLGPLVLG